MSAGATKPRFHPLVQRDDLQDGDVRAFEVNELRLVLVQQGGRPAVLEGFCPHAGHPLDAARIIGSNLRCDMHGYLFDVHEGTCTYYTEGPCRGLRVYPCVERDGQVGVMLQAI